MSLKRDLLTQAVAEDPVVDTFEAWLLEKCRAGAETSGMGPMRTMALEVLTEWRLAGSLADFRIWLESGAPSQDRT
jgi:hypothetical protein